MFKKDTKKIEEAIKEAIKKQTKELKEIEQIQKDLDEWFDSWATPEKISK